MTKKKSKRKIKLPTKRSAIILVACILAFSCFGLLVIKQTSDINKRQQLAENVAKECESIEAENAELREILESGDKDAYIERVARENGYVKPNERVYVDISDE